MRATQARTIGAVVCIFLVALLMVPTDVQGTQGTNATSISHLSSSAFAGTSSNQTVNLTVNTTSYNLSSVFWGATVEPRVNLYANQTQILNSTPTQIIVWPGANAGDYYNPLTNSILTTRTKGQPYFWETPPTGEAEFVSWCKSINCSAIFQVPGEIDNASFAAAVVNYTEKTLGFIPRYWEIGNEPELWYHWGLNWSAWAPGQALSPSPTQYAMEVANYTYAMRVADPAIKIIGIPATGRPNGPYPQNTTQWIQANIQTLGPLIPSQLVAEAYHDYPANIVKGTKNAPYSLLKFYNFLNSKVSIQGRAGGSGGLIQTINSLSENPTVCPQTCHISLFVTEMGSAISDTPYGRDYSDGFAGMLSDAAQITQAINLNISNVDIFSSISPSHNSWMTNSGSTRPVYTLYSQIFTHLGTEAFGVNISGLGSSVFGAATLAPRDGNRSDLLVVNTNLTYGATFTPTLPDNSGHEPVEMWEWSGTPNFTELKNNDGQILVPNTPFPVASYYPTGLPPTLTLPPQSVAIIESYPTMAYPVQFLRTGFIPLDRNGSAVRWYGWVNGQLFETNATNYTLLMPNESLNLSAVPIPLPVNTNLSYPLQRAEPFVGDAVVKGAPLQVTVNFALQARLIIRSYPDYGGTVTPDSLWVNVSQMHNLTAIPSPGWVFDRWFGWNVSPPPGTNWTNLNASNSSPSINATNDTLPSVQVEVNNVDIGENATFAFGYPVAFTETGLPPSTPWSASIDGLQTESLRTTTTSNLFLEANGTWGYKIAAPVGYIAHPNAGAVSVNGSAAVVTVTFTPVETPPPEYGVMFLETGLPDGTLWTATARGVTVSSTSDSIQFLAPNGTFGYSVQNVTGYRAPQANGSFIVSGMPTTVTIAFQTLDPAPTTFPIVWSEQGLPRGTIWSVWVQPTRSPGVNLSASNATITYAEPNGTYGFQISNPTDYRSIVGNVSTSDASVNVTGGPASVPILFIPTDVHVPRIYTVFWIETGLWNVTGGTNPAPPPWTVQLWGPAYNLTTLQSNGSTVMALTGGSVGLPNGTYSYVIPEVDGFIPEPAEGTFQVLGGPVKNLTQPITLTLQFALPIPVFSISVRVTGLPSGVLWQIRVSDVPFNTTADSVSLSLPNGAYTFDVSDPPGYFAVPSHGVVTVSNASVTLAITFEPTHPPPPPSIWVVAPAVLTILGVIVVAGWGMFSLIGFVLRRRSGAKR